MCVWGGGVADIAQWSHVSKIWFAKLGLGGGLGPQPLDPLPDVRCRVRCGSRICVRGWGGRDFADIAQWKKFGPQNGGSRGAPLDPHLRVTCMQLFSHRMDNRSSGQTTINQFLISNKMTQKNITGVMRSFMNTK